IPGPMWGASRVVIRATGAGQRLGGLAEQLIEWLDGRGGEAPLDTAARHFRKPLWEVADRLARVGAAELHVVPAEAEPGTPGERRAALRGDRERENARVSPRGAARAGGGPRGDRPGAGDRPHPPDGEPGARHVREQRGGPPQRVIRRRARRRLAAPPPRRAAG